MRAYNYEKCCRDKCVLDNGRAVSEIAEDFGSAAKGNVVGTSISHVGDLLLAFGAISSYFICESRNEIRRKSVRCGRID